MKTGLLAGALLAALATGVHHEAAALPGDGTLYDLIRQAERHAEQGRWEIVRETADRLEEHVNKRYWLFQLLGDEEEYETLKRDVAQLKLAVQERSRLEVLLLLADIRTILDQIYSL